MRARISRRVKGSTGYKERGSKRLDSLRPEETLRGVRTGRLYGPFPSMGRIGQDGWQRRGTIEWQWCGTCPAACNLATANSLLIS